MKRTDEEKLLIATKEGGAAWPLQIRTQSARIHHKWCTPWCVACVLIVAICIIVSASWLKGGPLTVINMELVYLSDHDNSTEQPQVDNTSESVSSTQEPGLQCALENESKRFDCHPDSLPTKERCEKRGCCWNPSTSTTSLPSCFFSTNYESYEIEKKLQETDFGFTATLSRKHLSPWPSDIMSLKVDLYLETETRFHFKIYDASKERYEVPISTPSVTKKAEKTDYQFSVQPKPFGIKLTRKSTDSVLFDTTVPGAPLLFAEQFLQISTQVPSGFLFGFNEHNSTLLRNLSDWHRFTIWKEDHWSQTVNDANPFYMSFDATSKAYGVFLLNSNAMEIDMQPFPAVTFRTIGGILDFYIFTGPTPDLVLQQYTDVIGKPIFPPYWALGLHLGSQGPMDSRSFKQFVSGTRTGHIPHDVYSIDADIFTEGGLESKISNDSYNFLEDLRSHGEKISVSIDATISIQPHGTYFPYDHGLELDVFIKNSSGHNLIIPSGKKGQVIVDPSHPLAINYWHDCMKQLHEKFNFEGIRLKMHPTAENSIQSTCANNTYNSPPYVPGIQNGRSSPLNKNAVCPSIQFKNHLDYNIHNLYGYLEVKSMQSALTKLRTPKRSLLMNQMSFPGIGQFSGVSVGDTSPTWSGLRSSISDILSYQLNGVTFVGVSLCGIANVPSEELCIRWYQLGAFYPFMGSLDSVDRESEALSTEAQNMIRSALKMRYSLLPYLYTLFFHSHLTGSAVVMPLFFQYASDKNTSLIDDQFLFGRALLISPVLHVGHTSVSAYFPGDMWYNYENGSVVPIQGGWINLPAPLDTINVHQRAGTIIPTQRDAVTTTAARKLPLTLQVALDLNSEATGSLYWDDGESIDAVEKDNYTTVQFTVKKGLLESKQVKKGYTPADSMILEKIRILGMQHKPSRIVVNKRKAQVNYLDNNVLFIEGLHLNLLKTIKVRWR